MLSDEDRARPVVHKIETQYDDDVGSWSAWMPLGDHAPGEYTVVHGCETEAEARRTLLKDLEDLEAALPAREPTPLASGTGKASMEGPSDGERESRSWAQMAASGNAGERLPEFRRSFVDEVPNASVAPPSGLRVRRSSE